MRYTNKKWLLIAGAVAVSAASLAYIQKKRLLDQGSIPWEEVLPEVSTGEEMVTVQMEGVIKGKMVETHFSPEQWAMIKQIAHMSRSDIYSVIISVAKERLGKA